MCLYFLFVSIEYVNISYNTGVYINNQVIIIFWVMTDLIHSLYFLSHCRPSIIPGPAPDELVIPAAESVGLFH